MKRIRYPERTSTRSISVGATVTRPLGENDSFAAQLRAHPGSDQDARSVIRRAAASGVLHRMTLRPAAPSSTPPPPDQHSAEHCGEGSRTTSYEGIAHLSAGEHDFRLAVGLRRDVRRRLILGEPAHHRDGELAIGNIGEIFVGGEFAGPRDEPGERLVGELLAAKPPSSATARPCARAADIRSRRFIRRGRSCPPASRGGGLR